MKSGGLAHRRPESSRLRYGMLLAQMVGQAAMREGKS